jgi:osmotically-inducible protein OsmY/gas vesicle protein
MNTRDIMELIGGIGMGAAVMYLLDPDMGQKRRRYLAQQAGHMAEDAGEMIGDTWHHLSDRASGLAHDVGGYTSGYAGDTAKQARKMSRRIGSGKWFGRSRTAADRVAKGAREYQRGVEDYARSWGEGFPERGRGVVSAAGHQLGNVGHYVAETARGLMPRRRRRHTYRDYIPSVHFGPREEGPSTTTLVVTAAGCALLGGALMYMLDPERGRRRRALVRDKVIRAGHATQDLARDTGRYMADKARGVAAETQAKFRREQMPDQTLVERVRAEMGRVVSHPGSIDVTATSGTVTLRGPILRDEVESLLSRVRSVRGVQDVQNQLEIHQTAGSVPGLQGQTERP